MERPVRRDHHGPGRASTSTRSRPGSGWRTSSRSRKFLGGSATNVAVAVARHGHRTAGDHAHRRGPVRPVRAPGAARVRRGRPVSSPGWPDLPTPVTFCEIFPPDDFPIYFYRYPKAPDLVIDDRRAGPGRDQRRADLLGHGHRAVRRSRPGRRRSPRCRPPAGAITVLDLDYRPMFWPSREEARGAGWARRSSTSPCRSATSTSATPRSASATRARAAKALRDKGVSLAVVKQGPAGVLAVDGTGEVEVPPVPVEVVNGLGAGDASAARCATACCPAGTPSARCGSRTRRARSWRRGCRVRRPCRPRARSRS